MATDPMDVMPGIDDLERRAARRIPFFAWEYLASGTGDDRAVQDNLDGMAEVKLIPQLLKGELEPQIETELFGVRYAAPIGIAPVGLTGLIWPGADGALAETAAAKRIPYTMSTVCTEKPEVGGPAADGMGWFQLYPPRDPAIRADLIERAKASGFTALVITADVPASSRRERQRKARVRVPPIIGPTLIWQSALHPAWSMAVLRNGIPRFRGLETYVDNATMQRTAGFVGANLGGTLSWEYLAEVREMWDGPLVVKGILDVDDAVRCVETGADAVQVSNHGGRQLDGVPPAIDCLAPIVDRVGGQVPVLFDSGVRSGLDVARAIALGASFVFCGRAFMFGLGAMGAPGVGHAYEILRDGLINTMAQTGCTTLDQLSDRLDRTRP
jgi:L-lactate dehydrogenase (cytochrome)